MAVLSERIVLPPSFDLGTQYTQTDLGVLQRATEGLQQRLEEAEKDKRQANELHTSNTTKVHLLSWRAVDRGLP